MSTEHPSSETQLPEILRDLKLLCDFAYERGFHELGYDPVLSIGTFAEKAVEELQIVEREIDTPSQALLLLAKRNLCKTI